MRLILLPHSSTSDTHGTEVDVDAGTSVGALRPHLARLTGDRRWAADPLAVDDRLVADTDTAGHPPLVAGAVLRLGRGEPDTALVAVRATHHVAVLSGPRTGELIAVGAAPSTVGGHLVRIRRDRVVVGRRGGTGRRGGAGWPARRWRVGHRRTWGGETYELRTVTPQPDPEREAHSAAWVAPLAGAAALALVVRQPAFLLVALAAPVAAALPRLTRALRGHRQAVAPGRRGAASAEPGRDDAARGDEHVAEQVPDVAAVVARSAEAGLRPVPPAQVTAPWGSDGSLALVGPRELTVPRARSVVVGTVGSHGRVDVVALGAHASAWSWCATQRATQHTDLPAELVADRPADAGPTLVVVDGPTDLAPVAAWRRSAPSHHRLLLLVDSPDTVPAWCTAWTVVDVDSPTLAADVAARQAHRAACLRAATRASAVPDTVDLGTLDVPRAEPAAILAAWANADPSPRAPLGRGAGGVVDLALRDGPHVLVGGTTGSGKSELLVTLVLAQALRQPPHRLAVLLVDFKGGTGLGPVAGLPHVVDHVTDLDLAAAGRILVALRAELRRRERLLARARVRDLADLDPDDPATPPRLLVVVDELRALVDDVPDAGPALARLAAQGRALGIHLVLATQRPAGAVGADLRANVGVCIALRVRDGADSADLIDAPDAARLPVDRPGRALVRRGSGPLVHVQVARAGSAARRPPVRPVARPAAGVRSDASSGSTSAAAPSPEIRWRASAPGDCSPLDDVAAWVHAAVSAATALPVPAPAIPWFPALPDVVGAHELVTDDGPADAGLAFALGDEPDRQRRSVRRWAPDGGHLLIVGGRRSGRSTALVTLGLAALEAGRELHGLGLPDEARRRLELTASPSLGTFAACDQPRVVARLLELLTSGPTTGARPVLLVDGLDVVLDVLADVAHGAGTRRLTDLWRGGTPPVALAATCDARQAATHAAAFSDRLVLPVPDATTDLLLGVPRDLSLPRTAPGRAVHLRGASATLCQVALPDPADRTRIHPPARRRPPHVSPLPSRVERPDHLSRRGGRLPVGAGGDDASEVCVDVDGGLLVCGPAGSGRTTALRSLAHAAVAAGHRVLVARTPGPPSVGHHGPSPADPLADPPVDPPADPSGAFAGLHTWPPTAPGVGAAVVVVDDLDDLERRDPDLADRLLAEATSGGVTLLAAAGAAAAAAAFRGPLPWLLRRRSVLALDPGDPASGQLIGPEAPWLTDPGHIPGRGVLVVGRRCLPVQVYDAPAPSRAAPTPRAE